MEEYTVNFNFSNPHVRLHRKPCSNALRQWKDKRTGDLWKDFENLEDAKTEMLKAAKAL